MSSIASEEIAYSDDGSYSYISEDDSDDILKAATEKDEAEITMKDAESVRPKMEEHIQTAAQILGVSRDVATTLLLVHDWSNDALIEAYTKNPSATLQSAGISHSNQSNAPTATHSQPSECPICYEDTNHLLALPCNHGFCLSCWNDFLSNNVHSVRTGTTCPQAGCPLAVTPAAFGHLPAYQKHLLRNYLDHNQRGHRWCPGGRCERVAISTGDSQMDVYCDKCCITFCVGCGHKESHAPAVCRYVEEWVSGTGDYEKVTSGWIAVYTKPCPKCSVAIEKNQGCSHMTCQHCGYHFCWTCMGHFANYEHSCNTFVEPEKREENQERAAAEREFKWHAHCSERFEHHREAQAFAKKELGRVDDRIKKVCLGKIKDSDEDVQYWSDLEFLQKANERLIHCRRVLKYSYVHAYHAYNISKQDPSNAPFQNQRDQFLHQQGILERFTEKLTGLSETRLSKIDKQGIVDQTRAVQVFVENMLDFVHNG